MAHVQVPYVTLAALRTYRALDATQTKDDQTLQGLAVRASRIVDEICRGRRFYPWRELRKYDYPQQAFGKFEAGYWVGNTYYDIGGTVLAVDEDLLEVETLQTQGGDATVASTDYWLLTRDGRYQPSPYDLIKLKPNGATPAFLIKDQYEQANWVTGIWGFHQHWANEAWEDSTDALTAQATTTAGTVAVTAADGADLYGLTPRFQAGQLLKVDSEYVYVKAVQTAGTSHSLAVLRGVNGTIAATHSTAAAISIYRPMPEIVGATTRLASWLYQQRESSGDSQPEVQVSPQGIVSIPPRLPRDLYDQIAYYRKL
jgi:hypothetical protein